MIAGRVLDQARCLGLPNRIRGPGQEGQRTFAIRLDQERPRPERVPPGIWPKGRSRPSLAVVSGDFDRGDAVAAVPGDALGHER